MSRRTLTTKEQELFNESLTLFENLLDDLKSKNLLRKGISKSDREKLAAIWRNSRLVANAFNVIFDIFNSKEKVNSFVSKNAKEGITHEVLTFTFALQLFGVGLLNFESVFKTSLLFFLEEDAGFNRRMTLGQMLNALKGVSTFGTHVESKIDFKLRNSLAHGTFWFGKATVFLAENSYLEKVQPIPFVDFMIRIKKLNIVAHAFIEALLNKKVLRMLEELSIDYLGVSMDALLIFCPENIEALVLDCIKKIGIKIDIIGEVISDPKKGILIDKNGEEKDLHPKFREAAYTKIKKVVGETAPKDKEEMMEKAREAAELAIEKAEKVVKFIKQRQKFTE